MVARATITALLLSMPLAGVANESLSLNGITDYVVAKNTTTVLTSQVTFEAWIFPTNPGSSILEMKIVNAHTASYRDISLSYQESSIWWMIIDKQSVIHQIRSRAVVPPNQWHHVAGTHDGVQMHLYINGQEIVGTDRAVSRVPVFSTPFELIDRVTIGSIPVSFPTFPEVNRFFAGQLA